MKESDSSNSKVTLKLPALEADRLPPSVLSPLPLAVMRHVAQQKQQLRCKTAPAISLRPLPPTPQGSHLLAKAETVTTGVWSAEVAGQHGPGDVAPRRVSSVEQRQPVPLTTHSGLANVSIATDVCYNAHVLVMTSVKSGIANETYLAGSKQTVPCSTDHASKSEAPGVASLVAADLSLSLPPEMSLQAVPAVTQLAASQLAVQQRCMMPLPRSLSPPMAAMPPVRPAGPVDLPPLLRSVVLSASQEVVAGPESIGPGPRQRTAPPRSLPPFPSSEALGLSRKGPPTPPTRSTQNLLAAGARRREPTPVRNACAGSWRDTIGQP